MESKEIDFWSLVEYDAASKRLKDCLDNISEQLCLAAKDITSVILSLGQDGHKEFQFSDGTTDDLKKIASSACLYDSEFIMDVLATCLWNGNITSPDLLKSVRDICPRSFEYYILACKLLS